MKIEIIILKNIYMFTFFYFHAVIETDDFYAQNHHYTQIGPV